MRVAEGLLLRKQLEKKVEQLFPLKQFGDNGVFETKVERRNISETVDEVKLTTPKIAVADITAVYDFYAGQLRQLDSAIQQANWVNELDFTEGTPPKSPAEKR